MATVLAEAAIRRELAPEARIGPAGIALLPQRAPPEGQRYRVTLGKAREELERYLPAASQQAAYRLRSLIREGAFSPVIASARTALAYVSSDGRRVGEECVTTFKIRGSPAQ